MTDFRFSCLWFVMISALTRSFLFSLFVIFFRYLAALLSFICLRPLDFSTTVLRSRMFIPVTVVTTTDAAVVGLLCVISRSVCFHLSLVRVPTCARVLSPSISFCFSWRMRDVRVLRFVRVRIRTCCCCYCCCYCCCCHHLRRRLRRCHRSLSGLSSTCACCCFCWRVGCDNCRLPVHTQQMQMQFHAIEQPTGYPHRPPSLRLESRRTSISMDDVVRRTCSSGKWTVKNICI